MLKNLGLDLQNFGRLKMHTLKFSKSLQCK